MRLSISDEKIIELYFQRNEQALFETQIKYGNLCQTVAMNILGDREDAEECVNDTYLGVWNAIPPNRPNNFAAFMIKITRNLSLKKLRFKNAEKRKNDEYAISYDELSECIPDGFDISEKLNEDELSKILSDFLRNIPEVDRKIFILRYWYSESITEISKNFNFSESKVKMKLLRTRNNLREFLCEKGVFK